MQSELQLFTNSLRERYSAVYSDYRHHASIEFVREKYWLGVKDGRWNSHKQFRNFLGPKDFSQSTVDRVFGACGRGKKNKPPGLQTTLEMANRLGADERGFSATLPKRRYLLGHILRSDRVDRQVGIRNRVLDDTTVKKVDEAVGLLGDIEDAVFEAPEQFEAWCQEKLKTHSQFDPAELRRSAAWMYARRRLPTFVYDVMNAADSMGDHTLRRDVQFLSTVRGELIEAVKLVAMNLAGQSKDYVKALENKEVQDNVFDLVQKRLESFRVHRSEPVRLLLLDHYEFDDKRIRELIDAEEPMQQVCLSPRLSRQVQNTLLTQASVRRLSE